MLSTNLEKECHTTECQKWVSKEEALCWEVEYYLNKCQRALSCATETYQDLQKNEKKLNLREKKLDKMPREIQEDSGTIKTVSDVSVETGMKRAFVWPQARKS